MEQELLRLRALLMVQAADTSCLLELVLELEDALRPAHPDLPDLAAVFLRRRIELVHHQLEELEKTQPALAAQLQQLIDHASKHFPFDY